MSGSYRNITGVVQALPSEAVGGNVPPGARDDGLSGRRAGCGLQHRGTQIM